MSNYYVRQELTYMFGSCPLTDEFIDDRFARAYSGIGAMADCAMYVRDVLRVPYTEEFQKIVDEERRKWDEANG